MAAYISKDFCEGITWEIREEDGKKKVNYTAFMFHLSALVFRLVVSLYFVSSNSLFTTTDELKDHDKADIFCFTYYVKFHISWNSLILQWN